MSPVASDDDVSSLTNQQIQQSLEVISVPTTSSQSTFSNWAKTFHCQPKRVFKPTTYFQCRQILELARRFNELGEEVTVHPVGVGHSPSDLSCTNGWLVRMEGIKGQISVDHEKQTATFRAGTVLHDIHKSLAAAVPPLAMPNIGSISDQTIGGLISTASHGSGTNFPVLSNHVRSLTIALPIPGTPVVHCSATEDPDLFKASLCGLGITGILLEVEIEVEDAFRLRETKESKSPDYVFDNLDIIKNSAEHVRLWWYPDGQGIVVGRANRTYEAPKPQTSLMAHILGFHVMQFFLCVARCFPSFTPYVGRYAFWLAKGDSEVVDEGYKVLNFDCLFPQYALEWAISSDKTKACLEAINEWLEEERKSAKGLRVHFPIEVRWSCEDDIWLSPSYGKETCWIGVVTYRPYGLPVPYKKFQERFSNILKSFDGRPHWAKQHDLKPKELESLYPKFDEFRRVTERVDPGRILQNEYVRRHLGGQDIDERLFKDRK